MPEKLARVILTDAERDVMLHALGVDKRVKKPYRNYFACAPDEKYYLPIWERLLARGLCTKRAPNSTFPYIYFHLNEAGARALGLELPG